MHSFFDIDKDILDLGTKAEKMCQDMFAQIDDTARYNQQKMQAAFNKAKVSGYHFVSSTGYGYGDTGRDTLDKVFAYALGAEDALVRENFVSGTHTLTVALFGMLRPNDKMICVTGTPYDTLLGVIGYERECDGSLKDYGVIYEQVDLLDDGTVDLKSIENIVDDSYKMVYIQRSRGYSTRPALSISDIEKIVKAVRKKSKNTIIMVDNCYGEYIETREPVEVGADIMAGSLIKNAGGGIAPTGGYIAGRADLIEKCSYRMTTPGTGREIGCTSHNLQLFMGTFNAPQATSSALKTAVFASAVFSLMGYDVSPSYDEQRGDIVECIKLGNKEALIAFCKGIQSAAPVDSFVVPIPDAMPGYDSEVIMAAGSFHLGSTIELSADAPLREPYAVWMQGALNYNSGHLGVLLAANSLKKDLAK